MTSDDDELQRELERLPVEIGPPAAARAQTVARLRDARLIGGGDAGRHRWRGPALAAAAVLLAFAGGWTLGRGSTSSPPRAGQYAFLLYGESDPSAGIDRVRQYTDWARGIARSGRAISGEKFGDESTTVGRPQTDRSDASSLGGFFIVEAESLADAVQLARNHPHARDGGTIVVRRIDR